MKERVFQDDGCFEVSDKYSDLDFNINNDRSVAVRCSEGGGWDSQITYFTLTEQEAKQLTAFLATEGY